MILITSLAAMIGFSIESFRCWRKARDIFMKDDPSLDENKLLSPKDTLATIYWFDRHLVAGLLALCGFISSIIVTIKIF